MHVNLEQAEKAIAAMCKKALDLDTKMCIAVVELRGQSEILPAHG